MRCRSVALSLGLLACSSTSPGPQLPQVGSWQVIPAGVGQPAVPGLEWAWTGSRLFAMGSANAWQSNSPASLLDPATGVWTPASGAGAPGPRDHGFTAWTGTEVFVWSGELTGDLADGALYDPAGDAWRPIPPAPIAPRHIGTTVWTGSVVIVWGGQSHDSANNIVSFNDGAKFDPAAGSWTALSVSGAPSPRSWSTAVWTGTRMLVWGGGLDATVPMGDGAAYDPAADVWAPISAAGAPSARYAHAAVWTGTEMVVLAGLCAGSSFCKDGGRYDPATDSWTSFSIPAPDGYVTGTSAAWTGDAVLTWGWAPSRTGGWGGLYNPQTASWTEMAPAPSQVVGRAPDVVTWTGTSAIIHGGNMNRVLVQTGALFTP